jgi:hypothetical protein
MDKLPDNPNQHDEVTYYYPAAARRVGLAE